MGKGNAGNQKISATDFTKFRLLRKRLKVLDRSSLKRNDLDFLKEAFSLGVAGLGKEKDFGLIGFDQKFNSAAQHFCFGDDAGRNNRIVHSCHGLKNFWMGVMECGEDVGVEEVHG